MSTFAVVESRSVGMGQIVLAHAPGQLTAVLGSCVGLALHHPQRRVGILGHIVLPYSGGRSGNAGKFADTAVPTMIQQMLEAGAPARALVAKIAGGAQMFGSGGPMQIGASNVEAITRALAAAGIRLVGQDVGGGKGRRVILDCATGEFTVQCVGERSRQV